jgi:TRAP-type C4-dicarboxylate transport system permease large subunit
MKHVSRIGSHSLLAAGIVCGALLNVSSALACPLCSENTEAKQEETGVNVAMGYTVSVLFMITVPVCMAAGFGYFLYRNSKNEAAYLASLKEQSTPELPTETNQT